MEAFEEDDLILKTLTKFSDPKYPDKNQEHFSW